MLAKPRLVVVSPDSDLFHPQVSDASLLRAFRAMRATPMHTYLVLTKRPERLLDFSRRLVLADGFRGEYLTTSETRGRPYLPLAGHVRIGVSAENQDLFDARLAVLAQVRAARKFVAVEPMLGPVRLTAKQAVGLRWVLISGEEGKGGRVCQAEWIAALAADARARKVPAYVNQVGSFFWDGNEPVPVTGTAGTDMAEWPAAVRIREEFNDGDL